MKVFRSAKALQAFLKAHRAKKHSIGFVPTMGALHAGHGALIKRSVKENDLTLVSIFVNPLQFGPKEDLKKYPRTLAKDKAMLTSLKVDILFYPPLKEIYPSYPKVDSRLKIKAGPLAHNLCGKSRPGHFDGVATVVFKLLRITSPTNLYLGQKDIQQALILKKMVSDFALPHRVKIVSTVRGPGGLALSSRNSYLSDEERESARVLFKAIRLAKRCLAQGEHDGGKIISKIKKLILEEKSASIDYVSITDPLTLKPVRVLNKKVLLALAVKIGKTRLIDNVFLNVM